MLSRNEYYAAQAVAVAVAGLGVAMVVAAPAESLAVVLGRLAIVAGVVAGLVCRRVYRESEMKRRFARRVVAWLRDQGDRLAGHSEQAIENWRRIVGKNLSRPPFRRDVAHTCLATDGDALRDPMACLRMMSGDIDKYIE